MNDSTMIPKMFLAGQSFDRPVVEDIPGTVHAELSRVLPKSQIAEGSRIGVTVGSRGISNIALIARAAIDYLKSAGAKPFIVIAMGSHGGASAKGQSELIAHYGVTEQNMGCPIRAQMATRMIGETAVGMPVYLAEAALDSDGIILLNRIKPHTDFKGPIESGLAKVAAIGLGKLEGATSYHNRIPQRGLGGAVVDAAEKILESGKVIAGLGILDNAYHETARIAGVYAKSLFDDEAKLLEEAYRLMGALPFDACDTLICDRIGKNISGTGMDTNIIGRSIKGFADGVPWHEGMPVINRIFIRSLSEESNGNAHGMGLAEFCTTRFLDTIDMEYSQINAITACSPLGVRRPVALANDKLAIETAIKTCGFRDRDYLVCFIRDTLSLDRLYLSEQYLTEEATMERVEVLSDPEPLSFDAEGWLHSPFEV